MTIIDLLRNEAGGQARTIFVAATATGVSNAMILGLANHAAMDQEAVDLRLLSMFVCAGLLGLRLPPQTFGGWGFEAEAVARFWRIASRLSITFAASLRSSGVSAFSADRAFISALSLFIDFFLGESHRAHCTDGVLFRRSLEVVKGFDGRHCIMAQLNTASPL